MFAPVLVMACSSEGWGLSPSPQPDGGARAADTGVRQVDTTPEANADSDADTDTDTDTDADSDADADADTDADADADTDADADADTDADADSDTDADSDSDGDADTDSDTDADPTPVAHTLELRASADDEFVLGLDGAGVLVGDDWSRSWTTTRSVMTGHHVMAIRAIDRLGGIAGVVADVWLDGTQIAATGDTKWLVTQDEPAADWAEVDYDPSLDSVTWTAPTACGADSSFGARPADLLDDGAAWVWSRACLDLGDAWLRLSFDAE